MKTVRYNDRPHYVVMDLGAKIVLTSASDLKTEVFAVPREYVERENPNGT